ncbi:MAG: NADP(H)-dependent aldo-keto reductase [Gammaproteobacteria bacterium]|nr:NADP(H)-dependent aldo-keto reductase [Gammaproteobacteria bacterium]
MEKRRLGRTDVEVSALCLGTMTYGEQNTEAEAHAQLDCAVDFGINFIDTAEMYPVPPRETTYGTTERHIGSWLKNTGRRTDVVIATKVIGRSDNPYIRGGGARLDRKNIEQALHASLQRLQTDYIDLYQLHWPDRNTNYFGQLGYRHDANDEAIPLLETLHVLQDAVQAGKIRHIGLSNETPWGVMRCIMHAEQARLPRVVSIQNPYSLINRSFEIGLAEVALREDVGLLAYSPLGFGVLTGKYLNGQRPAKGRLTLFDRFKRYTNPQGEQATAAYVALAQAHGLDPAQLALAFVTQQPFVTSTIIGASTMQQLQTNLNSISLSLSPALLAEIDNIHTAHPNPCP